MGGGGLVVVVQDWKKYVNHKNNKVTYNRFHSLIATVGQTLFYEGCYLYPYFTDKERELCTQKLCKSFSGRK